MTKEFIARQALPAQLWARVLGHLVSLEKLVPYGRVRLRPLQSLELVPRAFSPHLLVPIKMYCQQSLDGCSSLISSGG